MESVNQVMNLVFCKLISRIIEVSPYYGSRLFLIIQFP